MRLRYLLDTDTVSSALRGAGRVGERILARRPSELAVSSITVAELRFGAALRGSRKLSRQISAFLQPLSVLPFDETAAERFGTLVVALRQAGSQIGTFDTLLAAQALVSGLTMVTNNIRHFERIPGLEVESWT